MAKESFASSGNDVFVIIAGNRLFTMWRYQYADPRLYAPLRSILSPCQTVSGNSDAGASKVRDLLIRHRLQKLECASAKRNALGQSCYACSERLLRAERGETIMSVRATCAEARNCDCRYEKKTH